MSITETQLTVLPKLSKQILHEILSYIYPMCINCKKFIGNEFYIGNINFYPAYYNIRNELKINDCESINNFRNLMDNMTSKKNTYVIIKYEKIKSVIRANNHIEVNNNGYVARSYKNNKERGTKFVINEKLIRNIYFNCSHTISCSKECYEKSKDKYLIYIIDKAKDNTDDEMDFNDEFMEKYDNEYMPFGDNKETLRNIYRYDTEYIYNLLENIGIDKLYEYPIMKEFINDIKNYDISELADDIIYYNMNY